MAKIQSHSGDSLADTYDVQGSIAGIDELQSRDVNLVHEMGSTIFSERLEALIIPIATAAQSASTSWAVNFTVLETSRLLGLAVVCDDPARLSNCSVHIESTGGLGDECPIWFWDGTSDSSKIIRIRLAGSLSIERALVPAGPPIVPNLLIGRDSRISANIISFRGTTTAFGAGTVLTKAVIYLAFPSRASDTSSHGLPLPGW